MLNLTTMSFQAGPSGVSKNFGGTPMKLFEARDIDERVSPVKPGSNYGSSSILSQNLDDIPTEELLQRFKTYAKPRTDFYKLKQPAKPRELLKDDDESELYAIMPPLETFMAVNSDSRRKQFFKVTID